MASTGAGRPEPLGRRLTEARDVIVERLVKGLAGTLRAAVVLRCGNWSQTVAALLLPRLIAVAEADATILFGGGIATDQLWFQQSANDLKVTLIGTTDSVTVSNWFANDGNHVSTLQTADGHVLADSTVQNLVSAMAGLTPPPIGQTTLTTPQHQQLDSVIAVNWH